MGGGDGVIEFSMVKQGSASRGPADPVPAILSASVRIDDGPPLLIATDGNGGW